ncbi:sigma 54-interacting transcriptional regulator [Salicibibacter cibarius]|uniref:Sigma 54-interacting transcriptional regulator n=1 Tax=Salicibibacter cibarius TaxID=2743000 RepID=A0A7T6Z2Y3_9BACI|nr:sigma 54-interacting transcriptional regulator [Salicibibacter cibarius]QQK75771.1 sigma 54-interacting transcriptional regulator [Salicibibacter cibarius]
MTSFIARKVHPFLTISIEPFEQQWQEKLKNTQTSFLFLTENGTIISYIFLKDVYKNHVDFTLETLRSYAQPIDDLSVIHQNQSLASLPFIFQILGAPITLVKNEAHQYNGYIHREDLLVELLRQEDNNTNVLKMMLSSIPMGIFIADHHNKIVDYNEAGLKMMKASPRQMEGAEANQWFNKNLLNHVYETKREVLNQIQVEGEVGVLVDYSPIVNQWGASDGIMIIVQDLPMVEEMAMEIEYVKNLNADLNAILASMYDEIVVVNAEGDVLRYNEHFITNAGGSVLKVGDNLFAIENQHYFSPSVAHLVLEKKEKISIIQETSAEKNILTTGNPVFDEEGHIHRIVIAFRDITETTQLKSELQETKALNKRFKEELEILKRRDKIIYCSSEMEQVMAKVYKLGEFHSSVLIMGESGVGKELIAQSIHRNGLRAQQPFLSINCGAIPGELLESELFGYAKGAFTGAHTKGKLGYFQQADQGVLLLDEIGEMSADLQVKLLRVLQEGQVTPVGSAKPIAIDVQIIAATNKNLEKMVEEGTFREDLYYRINVIPITVPPLRERPEDIPLLAYHFLQQLNLKYDKNYLLSPEAMNVLEVHTWPGNIRELENIIERLVVTSDEQVISADLVRSFLKLGTRSGKQKPIITDIVPYYEAQESIEEQLILLAMEKYKTTTKAAKALQISQPAVSRKYNKILRKQVGID